ncbi:hypothetical protein MBLNU230_g2347t1 [Neophaeotheca triangularis]
MRPSVALTAALLASPAIAAPTPNPGLIGDIFGLVSNIVHHVADDVHTVLNQVGIVLRNNAKKHGPVTPYQDFMPWPVIKKPADGRHHSVNINWPHQGQQFLNWRTYKSNGANLGGWLAREKTHDPDWFNSLDPTAPDEWTLCANLGDQCGPAFEARYASFLNTTTVDDLAAVGVNTLRITTTYAAWIKVPGSQLYSGNQKDYLSTITNYAIEKYGMHIIVGLHSLPGGINSLDIGEALGHSNWFNNATNLDYSFKAVDEVLDWMKQSGHLNSFTFQAINEASDTHLQGFGTPAGLTEDGANWVLTYMDGVFKKVEKVDKRIPVMLQDNFKGASYWQPLFNKKKNLVIDSHVYYFAAAGTYSQYIPPTVCGQGQYLRDQVTTFPIFVGEFSLQTKYNNTFEARKQIFDTQRWAWQNYVSGGAFWTAVTYTHDKVDGEGVQTDYWCYIDLINQGVITSQTNETYCTN